MFIFRPTAPLGLSIILLAVWALLSGCVSVNLSTDKSKKDSELKITAPAKNYKPVYMTRLDYSWRDHNTDSTIGIFSECKKESEHTLLEIRTGLLNPIVGAEVLEDSRKSEKNFGSLRSLVRSKTENKKTYTDMAIYKSKKCVYIITHIAFEKNIAKKIYDQFLIKFEEQL